MKITILFVLLGLQSLSLSSQTAFTKYFSDGSLRVDFVIAGDQNTAEVYLQSLKKEAYWGGSKSNLIDEMGYGEYFCKVFTVGSNELIYSRGFSTLFQEWQTTAEASVVKKAFYESTNIPFPLSPVRFEIYQRNRKAEYDLKFSLKIDPSDYFIQPSTTTAYNVEKINVTGDPSESIDIVFIPEGYTSLQMEDFKSDIRRLTDSLFTVKPFSTYRSKFNLYAVIAPSEEEGSDIPGAHLWKNTLLNSSFYTFDSERYLTTLDFWKVKDVAALAPYDQIYVLVNTKKYGGGGVYNHFSLTSSSNRLSPEVFIHEFGHAFAGLGDEYYTSDVSYTDFYSPETEPWEPNLTTLANFNVKWKNMLDPGTPVPTPAVSPYLNKTGVFEGGGYVAKGVYRPAIDCRMKSNDTPNFCAVCEKSIEKMILFLTK